MRKRLTMLMIALLICSQVGPVHAAPSGLEDVLDLASGESPPGTGDNAAIEQDRRHDDPANGSAPAIDESAGRPPLPVVALPPPPLLPPLAQPVRLRPRKAMMITGFSVFGTSFLASLAIGVAVYDSVHYEKQANFDPQQAAEWDYHVRRADRRAYGRRMSVPIIGPWLALGTVNSAAAALGTAFLGAVQLTGLTLGIVGTSNYVLDRRRAQKQRLSLGVVPTRGGAHSQVSWRF